MLLRRAISEFLASLTPEAGLAKRQYERRNVASPGLLGVTLGADRTFRPLHRVWLTDVSEGGVGALIEHRLPTQMIMTISLQSLLGRPCLMPMRIVYCRQLLPHTFRIGGCFALAA